MREYHEDGIDLYCADCLEYLKTIPDKSIDLVLTDPPYGHNNNNGDLKIDITYKFILIIMCLYGGLKLL